MRRAFFIAMKDLRLLVRDRMALFWAFFFPVAFALFIGSVMAASVSRDSARVPVAFVDAAKNEASLRLRSEIEAAGGLGLSSESSQDRAREAVRHGERLGYVLVPAGFPESEVEVGVDPSRAAESAMIQSALTAAVMKMRSPPTLTVGPEPIKRVAVLRSATPPNAFALVFPSAIAWGLMGCAATFAVAMVAERSGGTLIRLRAAPLSRRALVLGKSLACAIACVVDAAVLLVIARVGFGVTIDNAASLAVALGSMTACFVGLTVFLSTLGTTEQAVSGAGWATLLFMAMLGGAMVPVSLMPEWLQRLSDLSPIRWGIFALEGALWRGLGPAQLLGPCAILTAVGAAGFALGLPLSARREA